HASWYVPEWWGRGDLVGFFVEGYLLGVFADYCTGEGDAFGGQDRATRGSEGFVARPGSSERLTRDGSFVFVVFHVPLVKKPGEGAVRGASPGQLLDGDGV